MANSMLSLVIILTLLLLKKKKKRRNKNQLLSQNPKQLLNQVAGEISVERISQLIKILKLLFLISHSLLNQKILILLISFLNTKRMELNVIQHVMEIHFQVDQNINQHIKEGHHLLTAEAYTIIHHTFQSHLPFIKCLSFQKQFAQTIPCLLVQKVLIETYLQLKEVITVIAPMVATIIVLIAYQHQEDTQLVLQLHQII